jgi:hypothetical protein
MPNAQPTPDTYLRPSGSKPVEQTLSYHMARRAVWVAPLLVAGAWLWRAGDGAVGAAVGIGLVVLNFMAAGWLLSKAASLSLALYHAAALFGFFLRLALITVSMLLVVNVTSIDRLSLGIAVVVSYLVLLMLEVAAVARGRERELDW